MKVLVAGIGKTGTTGVYYDLVASHPFEITAFEPKRISNVPAGSSVLVKSIRMGDALKHASEFDRSILISRNPVDQLISFLMFAPGGPRGFSDDDNVRRYLKCVTRVRTRSIPFTRLLAEFTRISKQAAIHANLDLVCKANRKKHFFCLRYEDYVCGKYEAINEYLGFELREGQPEGEHARVIRTKGSGAWKQWLSESDVDYFNEKFALFNEQFGYQLDPCELTDGAANMTYAEEYVISVINQYREKFKLPKFGETEFYGGEAFDSAVRSLRRGNFVQADADINKAISLDSRPEGYHLLRGKIRSRMDAKTGST